MWVVKPRVLLTQPASTWLQNPCTIFLRSIPLAERTAELSTSWKRIINSHGFYPFLPSSSIIFLFDMMWFQAPKLKSVIFQVKYSREPDNPTKCKQSVLHLSYFFWLACCCSLFDYAKGWLFITFICMGFRILGLMLDFTIVNLIFPYYSLQSQGFWS